MRTVSASFAFAFVLSLATFAAASDDRRASASAADLSLRSTAAVTQPVVADSFANQIPELDPKSGGLASLLAAAAVAVVTRRVTPRFQLKHG